MQLNYKPTRYVFGDIEGNERLQNLVLSALNNIQSNIVFLGDIINPINNNKGHLFDQSRKFLRTLFNRLNIKINTKYKSINEAYKNFATDLLNIINNRYNTFITDYNGEITSLSYDRMFTKVEYDPREDLNNNDIIFIVGNKEIRMMLNIIKHIQMFVRNNKYLVIVADEYYHDISVSTVNNTYMLSLSDINLLYTYFNLCRLSFIENSIIYIHKGGNLSTWANLYMITGIDPLKVCICGHEKMFGALKYYGKQTYYFDYTIYDQHYTEPLTADDIYLIIDVENRLVRMNNHKYLMRSEFVDKNIIRNGNKLTNVEIIGEPTEIKTIEAVEWHKESKAVHERMSVIDQALMSCQL